ncbi:MAG TPA: LacI family DNA-binding transcriptional regulator [Bryobacteraceae bacterium]|jgi:DNA-binding LacI/PurR family transcriptional regulator|nr:LacI family DNA-binding transcriptional regulator [Bryobacteraceae bacterium]
MGKHISIKDLAQIANVSHSTVSRALRNSPLVNAETSELIQRLANEHGYRPSWVGRSLVMRETRTIGCVVTNISDPFVGPVVRGVEAVANERNYAVFLANSNGDPYREMEVVRSFHERRVDGILVAASRVGGLYIPELAELEVPLVLINNQHSGEYAYSVSIDNPGASRDLMNHLLSLGHRRIAYIGDRGGGQSDGERRAGYELALKEAGIPLDRQLIEYGDSQPEGGCAAIRNLLRLRRRPTAVFCYNDLTALGAYAELRAAGLSAPGDISITGFDDLFFAPYLQPPLTTVRQPMHEMGRSAMTLLLELLAQNGDGAGELERNVKMSGELVVRKSTAPPGGN